MTDSLGSCFLAGADVPDFIAKDLGVADRIFFGVDVEVIRIDTEIHIYPLVQATVGCLFMHIIGDICFKDLITPFPAMIFFINPNGNDSHNNSSFFCAQLRNHLFKIIIRLPVAQDRFGDAGVGRRHGWVHQWFKSTPSKRHV